MLRERFGLGLGDLRFAVRALRPQWSDDQALATGRDLKLGVACDVQKVQNGAVDDDLRAVAYGWESFDHAACYNTVVNSMPL